MSAEPGDDIHRDEKIVTFTLAGQMFGIAMASLLEIRQWEEPTPLPGVPDYVRGVTNLRGNVVPVVDLAARLGWPPGVPHARSCILVVGFGGRQAGFLVDEMNDIVTISTGDIQPLPVIEGADTALLLGLVRVFAHSIVGGAAAERRGKDAGVMVSLIDVPALSLSRVRDMAA